MNVHIMSKDPCEYKLTNYIHINTNMHTGSAMVLDVARMQNPNGVVQAFVHVVAPPCKRTTVCYCNIYIFIINIYHI